MEKIKNKESEPIISTGAGYKKELSPAELLELQKEWGGFISSYQPELEEISKEVEAIEKDYEYSNEEVGAIEQTHAQIIEKIDLIEKAMGQSNLKHIQESAFKIIYDLAKTVDLLNNDTLSDPLETLIINNVRTITIALELNSAASKYARFFLLKLLRNPGYYKQSRQIELVLKKYIETRLKENEADVTDIRIAKWLLRQNTDTTNLRGLSLAFLRRYFQKNPEDYRFILECIETATDESMEEIGWRQIINILKPYGFGSETIEEIVNRWRFGGGSENFMPEAFAKNIETLGLIEAKRPGIAKFLMSKFGLYNFGRYPENLLIKQFDEYENQELPYGVVVFAEDDHNGFLFENKEELEKMADGLEGKYLIRIMEAHSKRYLLRLITRLRLKYGQDHKISFAVMGAHGNSSVITLGNVHTPDREIRIKDVIRYGGRKYKLFEGNATLILITCDTGEKGGIGSKISKSINLKTIAPMDHSGLESIKPKLKKDGVGFRVSYSHEVKAASFQPRIGKRRPAQR